MLDSLICILKIFKWCNAWSGEGFPEWDGGNRDVDSGGGLLLGLLLQQQRECNSIIFDVWSPLIVRKMGVWFMSKFAAFKQFNKILRTAKTFLGFSGWGGCHGWFLCLFWWDRFKQAIEIWRTTKAALRFSGVREGGRGWLWVAAVTPHLCSEWGHYSWIGGRHEGALWSNMFGDSPLSSFTSQV